MYEKIYKLRQEWAEGDAKRDAGLTVPQGVTRILDIPYGEDDLQKLDIYYPQGTEQPLPTIISIHGGGWFYGSKALYAHYCMRLALRGFTVVNFDYRLAPEHQYPAPAEDCCSVLRWVQHHGKDHCIDLENLFLLGDSAGGQLCQQVLTMVSNPEYAALFSFAPPRDLKIRACALNCGCYFIPLSRLVSPSRMGAIFEAYFPRDYMPIVPQLKFQKYITKDFPPAFVMSARYDYLKMMARPMYNILKKRGVPALLKIYGEKGQKEIGHVFHLNCRSDLARQCNDEQCAFFRSHMA